MIRNIIYFFTALSVIRLNIDYIKYSPVTVNKYNNIASRIVGVLLLLLRNPDSDLNYGKFAKFKCAQCGKGLFMKEGSSIGVV